MSLNGLDDAKVTEAYQGALAEGGGWFLLKYASRDAVEVLARGTGGASEARSAVAQYEEKSPLYGFLLYRRRKVLIKYVPDGTSRLLQARVAVHFNAVTDKFVPHDTVISIASADELSDSALASACSLHTAIPSNSSAATSTRSKLDEITEDAEEGQNIESAENAPSDTARPTTSSSKDAADILDRVKTADTPKTSVSHTTAESAHPQSEFDASNLRDSLKEYDSLFANGPDPRLSSQTARPALSDLYAEIYAQYKPKVKLGPRPRPSLDAKRPHTSGSGSQDASRPVSSLPAGMRVANRKNQESKRPKPRETAQVSGAASSSTLPVPPIPDLPLLSPSYSMSSASVKSLPLHIHPRITPEKQRLMKALELRKKQMQARQEKDKEEEKDKEDLGPADTVVEADDQAETVDETVDKTADETVDKTADETVDEAADETVDKTADEIVDKTVETKDSTDDNMPTAESAQENPEPSQDAVVGESVQDASESASDTPESTQDESSESAKKNSVERVVSDPAMTEKHTLHDNSNRDTTGSHAESDDLQSALSACSPTSAQTQGSSVAPSTRPSSISEDEKASLEQDARTVEQEEKAAEQDEKATEQNENALGQDDTQVPPEAASEPIKTVVEAPHTADEDDSIESSPTVVPDNESSMPDSETPVPSVEITLQPDSQATLLPQASVSDDALARQGQRKSMVLMPPDIQGASTSSRESLISSPSDVNFSESKRDKRASMTFSTSNQESKEKHHAVHESVYRSADNSEFEYLSDDSFMEELQSATLEEAKPISVSKSPIVPFFPRKISAPDLSVSERSVSQPYRVGRFNPEHPMPRKASGPWLPHANSDTAVVAKKINVSSGISQRIKALAEKSNRDSSASVSLVGASHSIAQRKSSFFSTPPPGSSPNTQSVKRLSRSSFANLSNSSTPDTKPVLQPPPSRGSSREGPPKFNVPPAFQKPESVQVTARIIRDGRTQRPTLTMPTERTPLDLHQSQITIDHKKSTPVTPKSPVKPKTEPSSRPPSSSRPHSSSQSRDGNLPRSSSESSWRSFGRRLSESKTEPKGQRSLSAHSSESADERRDDKKDRKDSRAQKLFKRMSSISAITRKTAATSPIQGDDAHTSLPSLREPPPSVQVGDLNIQFPDTLLWKRRWVEIDGTGNLVLSLSKSNEQSKGITKRFHLSEFRTPYAPDQDRQELPNSVILDFIDGRTLQCACETYMAQAQVLQILREAHDAWIAYSQAA